VDLVFRIEDPTGRKLFVIDFFRTETLLSDVDPDLVHRRTLDELSFGVTVESKYHG
jgi:hypothetical protein